ncbi:MAG: hypothetical protein HZA11_08600 [Nitrospirae bacterium]|nr:hypothetical protein [Nitrospirota bacterium]
MFLKVGHRGANVEKAHKNSLKVIVWTDFRAKGVDGIASDRPDIFRRINVR